MKKAGLLWVGVRPETQLRRGRLVRINWPKNLLHRATARVWSTTGNRIQIQVIWGQSDVSGFFAKISRSRLQFQSRRRCPLKRILAVVGVLALVGCQPSVDIERSAKEAAEPRNRALIEDLSRRLDVLEGKGPVVPPTAVVTPAAVPMSRSTSTAD